ncbi:hypothetical protein LPJ71_011630, partial [Coemansia sp. S17]
SYCLLYCRTITLLSQSHRNPSRCAEPVRPKQSPLLLGMEATSSDDVARHNDGVSLSSGELANKLEARFSVSPEPQT